MRINGWQCAIYSARLAGYTVNSTEVKVSPYSRVYASGIGHISVSPPVYSLKQIRKEVPQIPSAYGKFQTRRQNEADERACAWFQSRLRVVPVEQFTDERTDERTDDDAYRRKEETDDESDNATRDPKFTAAEALREPSGQDVVQYGDRHHGDTHPNQLLRGELHFVGEMQAKNAHVTQRRTRESGHDTTDQP